MSNRSVAARLALVLAAERLFAKHGLNGVSLRQINEAAGQRNSSAAHYHFGSREGVVRAVFEHRMRGVDARRSALLDALELEGKLGEARALVGAWVRPLAVELMPRPEGNTYVRCLDQVLRAWSAIPPELLRDLDGGWRRARRALETLLDDLPAPLLALRLTVATQQSIAALAQIELLMEQRRIARSSLPLRIENVIDMTLGGLTAPVSAETRSQLD